jgi:hypothetical protein
MAVIGRLHGSCSVLFHISLIYYCIWSIAYHLDDTHSNGFSLNFCIRLPSRIYPGNKLFLTPSKPIYFNKPKENKIGKTLLIMDLASVWTGLLCFPSPYILPLCQQIGSQLMDKRVGVVSYFIK